MADASDALQKYITAQNSIADLTRQAQEQGKDIADVSNTVKGLNINYANLAGDVNSTKVDVKGLQTTIGTANGDIAQLKLDAQNLQTLIAGKVDNATYTNFVNLTNQALNAKLTANDLNGYAKTADLQATANGLQLNIDSVNGRLDNLKIGGRNLLTNTDKDISVTSHTTDGWPAWANIDTGFSFEHGKTYTFSAEANNSTDKIAEASIRVWEPSTNTQVGIYAFPADGKRHSITFTIPNDSHDYHLLLYAGHAGIVPGVDVTTTYHHPKLEFGNVATDWSPAPEDVANDITQLSARITANSQQFSSYYTKSETDSKANTAKNDAINAIKGDTNWTGLTNIITNSGFLQAADGFVQKVQQTTLPMFNGGGVNLVSGTTEDIIVDDTGNTGTQGWRYKTIPINADLEVGDKITVSVENVVLTGNGDLSKWGATLYSTDISEMRANTYKINAGKNAKVTITVTSMNDVNKQTALLIYSGRISDTQGKKAIFHHLKVERGEIDTPYSPAPSDNVTQIAFSELSQSLEGLSSTVSGNYGDLQSQINQTAKNIRQEVSDKTSGLQTQITQQANSFNVSLNALRNETAWQKVTTAIDANNYTTTGNYWIQAVSNSNTPDGSAWAYLEVVAEPAVERIKQTWQRDNNANEAYIRLKTGNTWSDWQKAVTAGNIMAQINMSAGTTLIQNNKIYMDADSTIFSGKAFIPSAAISNLSADKITTGTLNAGLINVINLNASSITTGTINGANLKIDLNNGEVQFKRGRITSIANTLNINIDTGTMSVTDGVNNGVYFANGELKLMDDPLNITGTPKYGGLRRSAHIWSPGSAGAELHSPNGVFVGSDNYNGAFAGGSGIDGTSSGAALAVDKDGSATLNGANIVSVSGGSAYDIGYSMKNRPAIILGKSQSGWNPGDRTFIQGAFVHIESAYRNTNGASPNVYVAPDGALVRSTSASKYKTDIQRSYVSDYGERLLELPTATWMDKAETERYVDGESQDKPVRHFGMIAEDLADAGLEMLVSRGQDGELEGIQYDRIGPALIPVIKQLQDKVNKLEEKLNER